MRHTVFVALAAGALALSLSACAQAPDPHQTGDTEHHDQGDAMNHKDHDKHHGSGHGSADSSHDRANTCETIVLKSNVSVPDISAEHWELVRTVKKEVKTNIGNQTFVYMFYKDKRVQGAQVTVALASVSPPTITILMWEEGDKNMRTVINSNREVCVSPLYGSDGKRYGIAGLMEKVSAWANE